MIRLRRGIAGHAGIFQLRRCFGVRARVLPDLLFGGSPKNPALIVPRGGPTLAFADLDEQVKSVTHSLRMGGVNHGDVVSMVLPNSVSHVATFLGVAGARATAAPLNPGYTKEEFAFFLGDANTRVLVVPEDGNVAAESAAASLGIPVWRVKEDKGRVKFDGKPLGGAVLPSAADAEDTALFLHTSGTTSRPKGVPLTHMNILTSVKNICAHYELSPADRSLLVMPLFHVHGLVAGLLSPLASGGAVVLPPEGKFSASTFWKDYVEAGATWYTAVPTIHQVLLMRAPHDYPSSPPAIRFIRSCSDTLAPAVLERLEKTFHAPVSEAYAMTEAAHQMTANPLPQHGRRRPGYVGYGTGVKVAILDGNNKELPSGQIGEVCIQGDNVTAGYRNNPSANAAAFAGGWFHTGDQGVMDEDGFVRLTGRLKELIVRGGEKISPVEVDGVLLAHPAVAEAVAFAVPHPTLGAEVGAAVVLRPGAALTEDELSQHCAASLAAFKVPRRYFFADMVPRTATGKIQRRLVAEHFLSKSDGAGASAAAPAAATNAARSAPATDEVDGYTMVARSLAGMKVRHAFGVVGIPITALAPALQKEGIRFVAMRNEQAAAYAASAVGYLTGVPGVCLTVGGPGVMHALAGVANAQANTWPMLLLSGSHDPRLNARGAFQELNAVSVVSPFTKAAEKPRSLHQLPATIALAMKSTTTGRPGPAFVDLPAPILRDHVQRGAAEKALTGAVDRVDATRKVELAAQGLPDDLGPALKVLRSAQRPLLVLGKGACFAHAEMEAAEFVRATGVPFITTPMGKGVLGARHPLDVGAARSLAMKGADVALLVGARPNWMLHFGATPQWASDVTFIQVDVDSDVLRPHGAKHVFVRGDARIVLRHLASESGLTVSADGNWVSPLRAKSTEAANALAKRLSQDKVPLDFLTAHRVLRDALAKIDNHYLVCEGANTMDTSRVVYDHAHPRHRLDAGTWGAMGVGLGYAIAASAVDPKGLVVAVEGDSAFGFSAMECDTICRYKMPIVVVVFNNGGIYGGTGRASSSGDPHPTALNAAAKYDQMMVALGGEGYVARNATELATVAHTAFTRRRPSLINVIIDPAAGVESGSLKSHN